MSDPTPPWASAGTKSDVAAGAIGYVAGFLIDLLLLPGGVPPGTTAGVCAVGAIGIKNGAESAWKSWKGADRRPRDFAHSLRTKGERFLSVMEADLKASDGRGNPSLQTLLAGVRRDSVLWEAGILSDDAFASALDQAIETYRQLT